MPYELDEKHAWGLSITSLRQEVKEAREAGLSVRALVFINPGNPTGGSGPWLRVRAGAAWPNHLCSALSTGLDREQQSVPSLLAMPGGG